MMYKITVSRIKLRCRKNRIVGWETFIDSTNSRILRYKIKSTYTNSRIYIFLQRPSYALQR